MHLRINLLFVHTTDQYRDSLVAECTVDNQCLRTSSGGVKVSPGLFEWPERTGLLQFSDVVDDRRSFKIGFFQINKEGEETPVGFSLLSGNQEFETVTIQGINDEGTFYACFETQWLPSKRDIIMQSSPPTRNYSILIKLSSPYTTTLATQRSEEQEDDKFEKYWFSYKYCRFEVKTEAFVDPSKPRFQPLEDTIRIRGNSNDIEEYIMSNPLLLKLYSSKRGLLGIIALSHRHQPGRLATYVWKQNVQQDEDEIILGEVFASLELSEKIKNDPLPEPRSMTGTPASIINEFEQPPPPPPPPLPIPSSSSSVNMQKPVSNQELQETKKPSETVSSLDVRRIENPQDVQFRLDLMEKEFKVRLRNVQQTQKRLEEMEDKAVRTLNNLEKRERMLSIKEEDFKRVSSQHQADVKAMEKKLQEELESKMSLEVLKREQVEIRLKDTMQELKKAQGRANRLDSELISFKDSIASSTYGKQEKELSKLRGQIEELNQRITREREEKTALLRTKDEQIYVLKMELDNIRLKERKQPSTTNFVEGAVRRELHDLTGEEEELERLRKTLPRKVKAQSATSKPPAATYFSTAQVPNVQQQLIGLRKTRQDLERTYPEGHAILKQIDAQIAKAEAKARLT